MREKQGVSKHKNNITLRVNKTKTNIEYEPFRENCTIFKEKNCKKHFRLLKILFND